MSIEEHMELWRKKEPWFYSRLVFNEYSYIIIMGLIFSLVVSCSILYPISTNLLAVFIGYFLAQFIFGWGHMTTHALYMESPPEDWEPGVLIAFLHHYKHPKFIYRFWLNHRLNFLMQTKGCLVAYVGAWVIPFIFLGGEVLPLFCWYLFWFSMVEPVHEYYHVPHQIRKLHFSLPMYYWLRTLEACRLINEKTHAAHHNHAESSPAVGKFTDLYFPGLDQYFQYVWRVSLNVSARLRNNNTFLATPIRSSIYTQGAVSIPLAFTLSSYIFCWGGM